MAIYEYNCKECGHQFDARRPMSQADAPIACPKCESMTTKRAISTFFASTKGSGPIAGAGGGSSCSSCTSSSCSSCAGH